MVNKKTILIVDDSKTDRALHRHYIENDPEHQYQVLEAESIEDGLLIWRSRKPDILLVDLHLGNSNGIKILKILHEDIYGDQKQKLLQNNIFKNVFRNNDDYVGVIPKLPVIMMTGSDRVRDAVDAMQAGAFDYLLKHEITQSSLLQSIRNLQAYLSINEQLEQSQKRELIVSRIALKVRQNLILEDICQAIASEVRQFLQADRTVIYKFTADSTKKIIAESVIEPWTSCMNLMTDSACHILEEAELARYTEGEILASSDIYNSDFSDCHVQMLTAFQVRANMVAPIVLSGYADKESSHLWGLLIVHQCDAPREWHDYEIQFLHQVSTQLAIAIQQAQIYQDLQIVNRSLEQQVQERTEELMYKEKKLRYIVDNLPDAVNLISTDGIYLESKQNNARYNSVPSQTNIVGQSIFTLLAPEIADRKISAIKAAIATGEVQRYEQTFNIGDELHYEEVRIVKIDDYSALCLARDITERRKAEMALRESEERFQKIMATSPGAIEIFVQHIDGSRDFEYLSPSFEKLKEITVESALQNPNLAFQQIHPDDVDFVWQTLQNSYETLTPFICEWRNINPSGRRKWLKCDANPERRINGDVAWYGVTLDITHQKQTELLLEQNVVKERMLNQFIQTIRSSFDLEFIFNSAIEAVGKLLGLSQASVVQYLPESKVWEHVAVLRQGSDIFDTLGLRIPDEDNPFAAKLKNLEAVVINNTDAISDPINREIADQSGGAWLLTPIVVNQKIWGSLSIRKEYSVHWWENHEIELIQMIANQLAIAIQQATLYQQLQAELAERKRTQVDLARAKEMAEAANRAKSDFLANMSHEIRTPMNGVLGMAQLLAATPLQADQRNFVQVILDSGDILLMIINDILDFSKIESGKFQLEQKEFSAVSAISAVCNLLSKQAFDKGINLQFHINSAGDRQFIGDKGRLKQILINLVGNAIKFTQQGNVTITYKSYPLEPQQGSQSREMYQFEFTISDTGIGIASDRIECLFKPFTQADASISRQYGGTGLGLVICKRFVEMMNGHIWVESRGNVGGNPPPNWNPNYSNVDQQGANFYFTVQLPLAQPLTLARTETLQEIPDVNAKDFPLKILLVEDNIFNQKIVQIMFQRMEYAIDVVNNGQECLTALFGEGEPLQSLNYDLLLMDVQMPVMDGLTATRLIRQRSGSSVKPWIIALTADAMPNDCQTCLNAGMNDYISKPIDIKTLKRSLNLFVRRTL